jgi:hypothetical protein
MHWIGGRLRALALTVMLCLAGGLALADDPLPVDELLEQIQAALVRVQDLSEEDDLPRLKNVKLSLQTTLAQDTSGRLAFFLVSVGGQTAQTRIQTLELTLVPPPPDAPVPVAAMDITEALAQAILAAAYGVKPAMEREPPLELVELVVNLRFVVDNSGGGSIGADLLPITVEFGAQVRSTEVQVLTLTFQDE